MMNTCLIINPISDQICFRNGCNNVTRVQIRCQEVSGGKVSYAGYDDIETAFDAFHNMQCAGLNVQLALLIPDAGVYLCVAQWIGPTGSEIVWENEPIR